MASSQPPHRHTKSLAWILCITIVLANAIIIFHESHNVVQWYELAAHFSTPPAPSKCDVAQLSSSLTKAPTIVRHPFSPPGLPIFVMGLPKSGTTSIHKYFRCGGVRSSHTHVKRNGPTMRTGECMDNNIQQGKAPLKNCGAYQVWGDSGYAPAPPNPPYCFYPSLHALDELYQYYPNATILMNVRSASNWANSVLQWGSLARRWELCQNDHMPESTKPEDLAVWYLEHNAHVREFARQHPSWHYIELEMESPVAGKRMEEYFGISENCSKLCRPGKDGSCAEPNITTAPGILSWLW